MNITINKWDDFQPRKDRTKHSWFRLNNDIIFSHNLDELTVEQKWFWICLLAHASRLGCGSFEYKPRYFEKHFTLSKPKMDKALEVLSEAGVIAVTDRLPVDTALTPTGSPTNKQTNKQTPDESGLGFDFEFLFHEYPRKVGKSEGIKNLKKQIKTPKDYEDFLLAIKKYKEFLKAENKQKQYTLYFSTFVGKKKEDSPWFFEWLKWEPDSPPKAIDPGLRIMAIEGDLDASGS